jgi:tryptophan 2,3-dioxygenase
MQLTHEILEKLDQLEKKYAVMGQDMLSYIEGLLYAEFLTYWDYIHLDTLLSLQNPKTPLPDEQIFIIYHQITELYFKLTLQAIQQIPDKASPELTHFKRQIKRVNSYFSHLIHSFEVMVDGMDKEEFLKFRMSLLPASGFQSAQYREIEIVSTDLKNLVHASKRDAFTEETSFEEMYSSLYWKSGATELATGKKTLTLRQFEKKYAKKFIELAKNIQDKNLWQCFLKLPKEAQEDKELIELLKEHDLNANVRWPLMHYKSAVRYLDRKPASIAATGGTNWQKYLPPKFQFVVFYPTLWSQEELKEWGKSMKL